MKQTSDNDFIQPTLVGCTIRDSVVSSCCSNHEVMTCDKLMSLSNRFPQNVCVVRTSRTRASSLELVEMLNTNYSPKVMFQPYPPHTHQAHTIACFLVHYLTTYTPRARQTSRTSTHVHDVCPPGVVGHEHLSETRPPWRSRP